MSLLLALSGIISQAPIARADPGNIMPPFNVGQNWTICQGYNQPNVTHSGVSAYGLDLTGGGCGNSASGRTVLAPIGGQVAYYQAAYGNLCINFGSRSLTLTHINSSITSGNVSAGQVVGTVAAPNERGNNGVAHIHFQMWATPNCYSSSGIPFDSANNARICGAPDLTSTGPSGGNGTWSGTSFTGAICGGQDPVSNVIHRVGVLQTNGHFLVKEGGVSNPWVDVLDNVSTGMVGGSRVGVLQTNGHFLVKESLTGPWTDVNNNVASGAVTSNRVAVLQTNGHLLVKEGGLGSPWVDVLDNVSTGTLSNNRIGALQTNGHFLVKEGNLSAPWVDVLDNVSKGSLTTQ